MMIVKKRLWLNDDHGGYVIVEGQKHEELSGKWLAYMDIHDGDHTITFFDVKREELDRLQEGIEFAKKVLDGKAKGAEV